MKRHITNREGFSLIELLVAMSLLSIGIFSVISMQVTAIKSNSIANRLSVATALAQETMDDILALDISDPLVNASTASDQTYNNINGPSTTSVSINGAGTFSATYSTTINTPVQGVTQVVVNIYSMTNGVNDATPLVTLTGCKRIT